MRRRGLLALVNRRKAILVKLSLVIPAAWIIAITVVSFSDWGPETKSPGLPNLMQAGVFERDEAKKQSSEQKHLLPPVTALEEQRDETKKQSSEEHQLLGKVFRLQRMAPSQVDVPAAVVVIERGTEGNEQPAPSESRKEQLESSSQETTEAPGYMGHPILLANLTREQDALVKAGYEEHAFNLYASDMMSLHRRLPDMRDQGCRTLPLDADLPSTSIIICFHNEAWSTLLRTVHSVLDRSPPSLVREILLVDDFSDKPYLGAKLDEYFRNYPKVKIVRTSKREGLIRARLVGADASTAPILTFLDSHCECTKGWLEPLLQRIADNWKNVVCPVIDVINDDTFEYNFRDPSYVNVGGFDWLLTFSWHNMPDSERLRRKHIWEPVRSPTMAGGLFSISKKFFEHLGTYDDGFDIWGGENLELSFKTWMCGGSLEILPCSHVGHVFRKRSPYKWRPGVNVILRNTARLAEVWLDDYKKFYYAQLGYSPGDFGDVTSRRELRKRLNCKSFEWYLKNVYPELDVPGEEIAHGEIRNLGGRANICLDSGGSDTDLHKPVGLYGCHMRGGNQYWLWTKRGEIMRGKYCLDYEGNQVVLYPCHRKGGNQFWLYDTLTRTIRHGGSRQQCLELFPDAMSVRVSGCNGGPFQKWQVQNYNISKAEAVFVA